jgi:hypothetical protein
VPGQIDAYTLDQNAIVGHKNGVTLKIDLRGTGKIDSTENFAGEVNLFSLGNISKTPYNSLPRTKQGSSPLIVSKLPVTTMTSTIQISTTTQSIFNASSTLFSTSSPLFTNASSTASSTAGN